MKKVCLLFSKKTAPAISKKHAPAALVKAIVVGVIAIGVTGFLSTAMAGPTERNQAKRMHDRLLGVPPSAAALDTMEAMIVGNDAVGAALWAIDPQGANDRKSSFYNVSLKNFFVPYTNVEGSKYEPLNDAATLMIGMVRDNEPFDQVLYGDILYVGTVGNGNNGEAATSAYSTMNNDHYEQMEANQADLSDITVLLLKTTQSGVGTLTQITGSDAPKYAGVITTRAFGEAYFKAGTNRRMWRFVSTNFMCRDLEDVKDITRIPDRIRQDVSRSPGGDSSIFLNSCIGCHSGMDPMAGAFAYYEWVEDANMANGHVTYNSTITHNPRPSDPTVTPVKHKYLINSGNFLQGYITVDDGWENYWREGQNAALGWGQGTPSGNGPTSLGAEVAATEAFARCQVERVYKHVCLDEPTAAHQAGLLTITGNFKTGYNLKTVFAETAALCMGD